MTTNAISNVKEVNTTNYSPRTEPSNYIIAINELVAEMLKVQHLSGQRKTDSIHKKQEEYKLLSKGAAEYGTSISRINAATAIINLGMCYALSQTDPTTATLLNSAQIPQNTANMLFVAPRQQSKDIESSLAQLKLADIQSSQPQGEGEKQAAQQLQEKALNNMASATR